MTSTQPSVNRTSEEFLDALDRAVGNTGWSVDADLLSPMLDDWRGKARGSTPVAVFPANTEEVAAVVKVCADHGHAITTQGGNTGLVNGGIPYGEVLLSLRRMTQIEPPDAGNASVIVEAGAILANVHKAVEAAGFFFPLSLGSQGSATVGGLVSTNAGGVGVLRYGMMRDLVLGIEAVLADGSVWNGLRTLRKDNTGYDLRGLMCGAEGTLGIVTRVALKLYSPVEKATAFCAVASPQEAVNLLSFMQSRVGDAITAFELVPQRGVELVLSQTGKPDPLPDADTSWRVLVETSDRTAETAYGMLEEALAGALEPEMCRTAILSQTGVQTKDIWALREDLPVAKRSTLQSVNFDISVPVSSVPELISRCRDIITGLDTDADVFAFGHIGDGNMHLSAIKERDGSGDPLTAVEEQLRAAIDDVTMSLGGSISAEHGIGLLKRDDLERRKPPEELAMMRAIKRALDPHNRLNPGRIFTLPEPSPSS